MEFRNLYLELVLTSVMLQVEKFLHCFHLSRLVEILSSKQFWKLFFYLHTFISFLPQILWQTILLARYHRWQNSWQTQLYQRMRGFSFALSPRKEHLKGFICIYWTIHIFIPQSIVGCPNEFGHLVHITSCAARLGVGPGWSCWCLCN